MSLTHQFEISRMTISQVEKKQYRTHTYLEITVKDRLWTCTLFANAELPSAEAEMLNLIKTWAAKANDPGIPITALFCDQHIIAIWSDDSKLPGTAIVSNASMFYEYLHRIDPGA